jgi:hypothetical protein
MAEEIEAGTVLFCDYLHLDSAECIKKFEKSNKEGTQESWKIFKVDSKARPVLILCETESFPKYRSYLVSKITSSENYKDKKGYYFLGSLFNEKPSYVSWYPEKYPDNLLNTDGDRKQLQKIILEGIIEGFNLSRLGCIPQKSRNNSKERK